MTVKPSATAPGGFVVFSHAGDDINLCRDHVHARLGDAPWKPGRANGRAAIHDEIEAMLSGNAAPPPPPLRLVCSYDYRDAAGNVVYQVRRFEPKTFRQRRPDGNGGWIDNLDGIARVPYRLPELAKYPDAPVFVTEGEKDCDNVRALDLTATCAAGNVWTPDMVAAIRGRTVIILADNDEPGRKKATAAAMAMHGIASTVQIAGFPELADNGDVSDFIAMGNDQAALIDRCRHVPLFEPTKAELADKVAPLPLTYYDDFGTSIRKRWLLKGIIARGETSAWVGPPGSGKSSLLSEIAVHCSAGLDWRGHRAKGRCGVVIFALERANLCRCRLAAYHRPGLPIAVAGNVIDLLNPDCAPLIVATVRKAERDLGLSVGLIVIDTYSKGIAAGAGDEDKARDQNRVAANLGKVKEGLDVHVALVGHTGKDESRGARGSNAHLADVDVMVQISGDNIAKLAQVVKANDQAERAIAEFKMEPVDLGLDEDGDMQTIWIVSAEHGEISAAKNRGGKAKGKLPAVPNAALRHLFELIADGETVKRPENIHVPVGVTCVTQAKWKERLANRGVINMEGSHRTQMHRINVTLSTAGIIGIWGEIVWPVT